MLTITKKLDISPRSVPHSTPQVINVSQYDSDFEIQFKLYASTGTFTIEEGTTAAIKGTKPSGTGYSADASIDIETKTVTVSGDVQMTAAAGRCIYEIALYKDNKEINSANFILLVERAALDADTITDESVLRNLEAIVEGAETATQAANDAVDAKTAAEAAQAAAEAAAEQAEGAIEVDDTLSVEGRAADAKVVGDEINSVKEDLTGLEVTKYRHDDTEFTAEIDGKYINSSTGNLETLSTYAITAPVAVKKGNLVVSYSRGSSVTSAIAYCDESQTTFEVVAANTSATELVKHEFVCTKDGYLCFGYVKSAGGSYSVRYNPVLNVPDDIETLFVDIGKIEQFVLDGSAVVKQNFVATNLVGKYIDAITNEIKNVSNFNMSDPVQVYKNDLIISRSKGFNITAAIAYCNQAQTVFETVVPNISNAQADDHTYLCPKDGYICFGYSTKADGYYSLYRNSVYKKILNNESRIDALESGNARSEEITIANSDKIGFFSNSFLNGYCMKTHHALDNISMFSDYILYNYGHSGYNVPMLLDAINSNEKWLGDVPVQNWGITYGVIAMQDNDVALYAIDPETYYENFKKCAEAVRAMGAIPILGTEHDNSKYYYALKKLAEDAGYMFMNWGKTAAALKNTVSFKPFWYNDHPSTRTAWLWSNGMKQYLDTLPRPRKSIKLFKVRPDTDTSDLTNLLFNNNEERAERYLEINRGARTFTAATESYFDRVSLSNVSVEDTKDDYQKLQSGDSAVSFGDYALVECVTPFAQGALNSLKMEIDATNVTSAYIKKNISLSDPLPSDQYVAFGVTDGIELLTHGTTFSITGGVFSNSLIGSYTVEEVVDNIVITTTSAAGKTTSGTDTPVCSISGVAMVGSYRYPSSNYLARYKKPLAEWQSITITNGEADLGAYISDCVNFDKVAILLVGSSISISDISFEAIGTAEKPVVSSEITEYKKGTSVLTSTLLDDGTAWKNISSIEAYTPVVSALDNTQTEMLPMGITTVRVLHEGDTLKQNILTSNLNKNPYINDKLQIRVTARYFPEYVDTNAKWATSEIVEGSYDCAKLSIKIDEEAELYDVPVGAYWNMYVFDTDYRGGGVFTLMCKSKSLQIAKVECDLIS